MQTRISALIVSVALLAFGGLLLKNGVLLHGIVILIAAWTAGCMWMLGRFGNLRIRAWIEEIGRDA